MRVIFEGDEKEVEGLYTLLAMGQARRVVDSGVVISLFCLMIVYFSQRFVVV